MKNKIGQSGQGLLEMVIAVAVINVGLFAVWGLFLSNFSGEQEARDRIVGANLAKEGVEVVRNIRDSNWLKREDNQACGDQVICSWDYGLDGLSENEVDAGYFYVVRGLFDDREDLGLELVSGDDKSDIYINDLGFFEQVYRDKPTNYKRKILLKDLCCRDDDSDLQCDNYDIGFCTQGRNMKVGLDVASKVYWQTKGSQKQIEIKNQLFNWK